MNKLYILSFMIIGSTFFCNISSENLDQNECRSNTRLLAGEEQSEWTVMIYMAARNNLAPFAGKNLQDIASVGLNDKIKVVAQWDQLNQKGAWRYVVKNKAVVHDHYLSVNNPADVAENLIDFVKWGAKEFPSKKVCLILWNHGVGALDPVFGDPLRFFMQNRDHLNSSEITIEEFYSQCTSDSRIMPEQSKPDRGILFDDDNKCYLSNKDLKYALAQITSPSILNKKIDCLGFDACFMQMLEVAYQVKDYASYMIGSEELELAKGWNYEYIFKKLLNQNSKTGKELATDIVDGFGEYYKDRTQFYTQASVDLSKVSLIKENNDKITELLEDNLRIYGKRMISAIGKARKSCLQFSAKFYIDLYSFYKHLALKVLAEEGIGKNPNASKDINLLAYDEGFLRSRGYDKSVTDLIMALKEGMRLIDIAVIKNTTSNYFSEAKGLSIYFPVTKVIDHSYGNNDFATESLWQRFLRLICDMF